MRFLLSLLLVVSTAHAGSFPATYNRASLSLTRSSGKVPLCVLANASATTSSQTANPFLDVQHTFNAGDPSSGNYAYGNPSVTSRNTQTGGPIFAHCYENSGSYTLSDVATDGVSTLAASSTVTASDWLGVDTYCGSNGTAMTPGVGGCPTGAHSVGSLSALPVSDITGGVYHNFVFKAGDSFTCNSACLLAVAGVAIRSSVINSTKFIIDGSANTGAVLTFNLTSSDIRIVDATIIGKNAAATDCVSASGSGTISQIAFLRVACTGTPNGGWNFGNGSYTGTTLADQWAIVDSSVQGLHSGAGHTAIFMEASNYMVMGNSLDGSGNGDGALQRNQYLGNAFIAHNSYVNAPATKDTVALAAPPFSTTGVYSQYVVFADNEVQPNTNKGINLGNHDAQEEWLRYFVIERTWFHNNPNGQNGLQGGGIFYGAIRNNIFDMSGSTSNDQKGIIVTSGTVGDGTNPADNIFVYNNTVFTSSACCSGGSYTGVRITATTPTPTNITVKNNLVVGSSATTGAGFPMGVNDSTGTATVSNNSTSGTSGQVKIPGFSFTTTPPTVPTDFKPVCTVAYPCAQGASVPVWSDYFLVSEPATRDLGAVVH